MTLPFASSSLGGRILWKMAVRIALVICAITFASYWHVYRAVTTTGIGTLEEYVRQRGDRESQLFLLAEDNLKALMNAFLEERAKPPPPGTNKAFEQAFARSADGAIRRRPGFDANREPSAYMAARVPVNDETRHEMMVILELVRDFGRAWVNRYKSAFFASLDGKAATYLPGIDWYQDLPPNEDFRRYPWVENVLPANNPQRTQKWTGIWYDWIGDSFAATCILPADIDGDFRYYAGTSVNLDDILKRTRETGLAGTQNMIFRADGKLISHPDDNVMATLRKQKGEFSILESGDRHLQGIYAKVRQSSGSGVVAFEAFDEYLGVARIAGPDWYFVTVLPMQALRDTAESTAQIVLWLGLASLLLELAIVGWIIRHQISQPLSRMMERVASFGRGDLAARIDVTGADELGRLGATFNQMAGTIEENQRELRMHAEQLEDMVAERTRQLEEKERAKTRFLAAASHDLRQPIQAVALFLDNLQRSALDARQRQTVDLLNLSVQSLRELLDTLLDISRLDAGAVAPQLESFELDELFARLEAEFVPQALAKDLRIQLRYPQHQLRLRSDFHLVLTILRNLVANALAYTNSGGVLVGARRRGGCVMLQVWDTGIGIAAEHLDQIYEEFFQVGNSQRDRRKGLGLGLAIARRAADLLGCRLACRSRPGRGTCFELDLPLDSGATPEIHAVAKAPAGLGGKQLVVIEDDLLAAKSLGQWLEASGCRIVMFASAEEALAAEGIDNADAYITDYRLPGSLHGIAFLDAMRARCGRDIRGIVLTGDTSSEFIDQAVHSGWRVLFKPVDPEQLRAALEL